MYPNTQPEEPNRPSDNGIDIHNTEQINQPAESNKQLFTRRFIVILALLLFSIVFLVVLFFIFNDNNVSTTKTVSTDKEKTTSTTKTCSEKVGLTSTKPYILSTDKTYSKQSIATSNNDESGVKQTSGILNLDNSTINTSGNTSSNDNSSFQGLNAGILASGGTINLSCVDVNTTGTSGNSVFAYGSGVVNIIGGTLTAKSDGGHSIMVAGGGTLTAKNVTATSAGAYGANIATDRGGGTINVTNGSYTTSGTDSPVIYSTDTIKVAGITGVAKGSEIAVTEGDGTVSATDSDLTGYLKRGVMIYQSFSGDAEGTGGSFKMTGGSLTQMVGPMFYATNVNGTVSISGVTVNAKSGVLIKAAADQWGNSGSNGGNLTLNATKETLTGDVEADSVSSISLVLKEDTSITGKINSSNSAKSISLTMDSTSRVTLTGKSYVTNLDGLVMRGSTVRNIIGNGNNLYYSKSANSSLGGQTYSLTNGGSLIPY